MRVHVLGCSGGLGAGLQTTSLRIDDDVLIDAGTGVAALDARAMASVRHILLTHSHLDHIAGIPLLLDTVFDRLGDTVTVYGQAETLDALRSHIFNNVIWPDFSRLPSPDRPVLRYRTLAPGEVLELGERRFEMLPARHVVPTVGYRVTSPSGGFAFTGDSTTNDAFWRALNSGPPIDVLIMEVAFPDEDVELCRKAGHYSPQMLAADLAKLEHRPKVYITHNKPGSELRIYEQCRAHLNGRPLYRLFGGQRFEL
ncbi:3',5'-cyclic-nucleotide phosphodiesterase [Ectothiorhodospiraceae bacterium 2226]|nr:3',5'-cyclic-nucleotide phosphodiesterase [Ectothiorhodospiraceae bacterium 2226]